MVIEEGDLRVPHPRFRERRFVLEPLMEIAPSLRVDGVAISEQLTRVRGQVIRRFQSSGSS
jgi:2-amino-4-hydroxy-6-hydroxymethyldihydropteridine diphosphokinase